MSKLIKIICVVSCVLLMSIAVAESKDIIKFGTNVEVEEGLQVSSAISIGGDAIINGTVDEDVVSIGGSVVLGKKAIVNGNVISVGGTVTKTKGARVAQRIIETSPADISTIIHSIPTEKATGFFHVFKVFRLIGFIALALLIVALFPAQVGKVSSSIESDPLKTFLWSILGVVLIFPLALILIFSIAGIMLIPLEILFIICSFIIGYVAFAQLVGKKAAASLKKENLPILVETMMGILVLLVISWIPFIGVLIILIGNLLGFGGVIATLFSSRKTA
ncbi:MAG: hypothetical protein A2Y40_07850 [Candidatus Margulisbacteria bacterium GWF2_35_9]|nr:MAG: hypothetical protein A2Y40_07850 [Candidatus Margulisbacteria bacterium GWF2_35_9]